MGSGCSPGTGSKFRQLNIVRKNSPQRTIVTFCAFIMGYKRQDVEQTKQYAKKFVRYKEGAEKYSLGLTKFQELAKEAKAVYKIDGIALVNCEIFEKFLESFREF